MDDVQNSSMEVISKTEDNNHHIHIHHHHHDPSMTSEMSKIPDDDVLEKKVPNLQSQRITYPTLSGSVGQLPPSLQSMIHHPSTTMRSEINTSEIKALPPSLGTTNVVTIPHPTNLEAPGNPNQSFHVLPQFGYNHAVVSQPTSLPPIPPTGTIGRYQSIPSGLNNLSQVNKALIYRKEDKCKESGVSLYQYKIMSEAGYKLFTATEEHFAWKKYGHGCQKKLMVHICDQEGKEVIKGTKELTFADYEMMVEAAVGEVCGYIRKTDRGFIILDSNKDIVLTIRESMTPFCVCQSFSSVVIGLDGSTVGRLTWQTWSKESSVTFPKDLDLKMKVILLCFSILNNSH